MTVPVQIDGREQNFAVDSGASATIIVNEVPRSGSPTRSITGAGSADCQAGVRPKTEVRVAGLRLRASPTTIDLRQQERFLGQRLPGVIGGDFFRGRAVTLRYAEKLVHVSAGSGRGIRVPMRSIGSLCCSVQGTLTVRRRSFRVRFLIDTGAPGFDVVLTRAAAERFALLPMSSDAKPLTIPGLCGSTTLVRVAGDARVRLVNAQSFAVELFASRDEQGALARAPYDGVIGGAFLRRWRDVTLDSPGHALWLHIEAERSPSR